MSSTFARLSRRSLPWLALLAAAAVVVVVVAAPSGASAASETEYTSSFSAQCVLGPGILNIGFTASIDTTAKGPGGVRSGQELTFKEASATVTVPVEVVESFAFLGAANVRGSITHLPATVTGGLPVSLNLAESPGGIPFAAPVEKGHPLTLVLPSEGPKLVWGPVTVTGKVGQSVTLAASTAPGFQEVEAGEYKETGEGIMGTISGYNAEGEKVIGPLKVVCDAPANVVFATVPIERTEHTPICTTPRPPIITPDQGPAGGGTTVEVHGGNVQNATGVEIGSTEVPFSLGGESLSFVTPPGTGTVAIRIEGECLTNYPGDFTYLSQPAVTSVTPAGGPASGGTVVTISGTGLTGATAVQFGGIEATSFKVESETSITAVTPPGAIGNPNAAVSVTTPAGVSSGRTFTYEAGITHITPSSGPAAGGTVVTITGPGIYEPPCQLGYCERAPNFIGVSFGSKKATSFRVGSEDELIAVAPPGTGTVDVTVQTVRGTTPPTPADRFTYIPPIEHLTFKAWPLSGTLTPKPLGQAITLPSRSSFNGSGELNTETNEGSVTGTITVPPFKAAAKLYGLLPVSLGMTIAQAGAISGSIAPSKSVPGDETLDAAREAQPRLHGPSGCSG